MAYGIYRVEKRTRGDVKGIQIHNNREKEGVCHTNHDIAWERTKENVTLVACNNYLQAIDKQIANLNLKRKPRKDAIVMLDHFIGGSPEFFQNKTKNETLAYFTDCLFAIENRFGHVVSATIHYDEATPHMHVVTVPITKDNRLCAKDLLGNRQAMSKIQDWFHKHVFAKYNLERGEVRSGDNAREHLDCMRFKRETTEKQMQTFQKEVDRLATSYENSQKLIEIAKGKVESLEREKNEIKGKIDGFKAISNVLSEVEVQQVEVKPVPLQKDKVIIDKREYESLRTTAQLVDDVLGKLEVLSSERKEMLKKTTKECQERIAQTEDYIEKMTLEKRNEWDELDRNIKSAKSTLSMYQKDIRKLERREESVAMREALIDEFKGCDSTNPFLRKPRIAETLFKAWEWFKATDEGKDKYSKAQNEVLNQFEHDLEYHVNELIADYGLEMLEKQNEERQMRKQQGFDFER